MPRRLSGNPSKQLRKDLSRESSGPTHATNRIPRSLRIPYLHLVGRFTSTVAFQTHRGGRDRDSLAFRTAAVAGSMMRDSVRSYMVRGSHGRQPAAGRRPPVVLFYVATLERWPRNQTSLAKDFLS